MTSDRVRVLDDGSIETDSRSAHRIVQVLGLNAPEYREFRLLWIGIIEMARRFDELLFDRLMGFPDNMPDLTRLNPPGGNEHPEGIATCFYQRRINGTLSRHLE